MKKVVIGIVVALLVVVSGFAVYSQSPSMKYGYSYKDLDEQGVSKYRKEIGGAIVSYSNALFFTKHRTATPGLSNDEWMETKSMFHDARYELDKALKGLEVPNEFKDDHEELISITEEADAIVDMSIERELSKIFEMSFELSERLSDIKHLVKYDGETTE